VITQPFYASARMLQEGLSDFSYEAGFVRDNYGVESDDYGRFIAVGTHRLGVSDRFTGEVHGEFLRDQQTLGFGGVLLWPGIGVFNAAVAGSHGERGSGASVVLGVEHQSRSFSYGASTQLSSANFVQLGLQPGRIAPRQRSQAFFSYATESHGSMALSYTHQDYRDQADVELVSASYSVTLGDIGYLSFSAIRFLSGDEKTVFGLNYTRRLGARTSASVNATAQPGNDQALLQVQRYLPVGSGFGYRLQAGVGDSDRYDAALSAQNDIGTYTVEASQASGQTGVRAGASGGVALAGGEFFLSRRIDESFAVVEVPDYPGVRIYQDNQLVARTGAAGSALLTRLRPYQRNPIRIEPADLPLDAEIDAVQLEAIPYFRSGLLLKFPIRRSRGGLINVVLDSGAPLPAGAVAQIVGADEEFPTGLRGQIYLTGLAASNRIRVTWREQSCEFPVPFPPTAEPLPELGTYTCAGMKP
jgi:outer membrane usher protein